MRQLPKVTQFTQNTRNPGLNFSLLSCSKEASIISRKGPECKWFRRCWPSELCFCCYIAKEAISNMQSNERGCVLRALSPWFRARCRSLCERENYTDLYSRGSACCNPPSRLLWRTREPWNPFVYLHSLPRELVKLKITLSTLDVRGQWSSQGKLIRERVRKHARGSGSGGQVAVMPLNQTQEVCGFHRSKLACIP